LSEERYVFEEYQGTGALSAVLQVKRDAGVVCEGMAGYWDLY
jgi:hypothetical protein